MVIKIRSIINAVARVSAFIFLALAIHKKCIHQTYAPSSVVVQADGLLAEHTEKALTDFMQSNTSVPSSHSFADALYARFPAVASFAVQQRPLGLYACIVQSAQPLLRVNNSFVLTDNGKIVSLADFAASAYQSLPHITVHDGRISNALYKTVQSLPADLLYAYSLVWIDDCQALLFDRSQPLFALRFNAGAIPSNDIIQACNKLKADLEQRGCFSATSTRKKPQQCVADIRFKNQIILSWHVEGERYG
jgi:hypothetical protein